MLKQHLKTQAAQWPPVAGVIGLFAAAGYVTVAALPLNAPAGAASNNVAGLCADLAPFPFFDDFETGQLGSFWATRSTGAGRIVVTEEHVPDDGTYHVTMDSGQSGVYSLNELVLCIDLSGKEVQKPFLSFRFTDFSDEAHVLPSEFSGSRNGDGVALSIGETDVWTRIVDLTSGSGETGLEYRVSLVDYAGQPHVQVKFQQFDNASIDADGIALDSIQVRNCNTSCGLSGDTEICDGESTEICANVGDAIPPFSFSWNTGATTQCITTDASGTYQASVTDGVGCSGTCASVLTVNANPVADAGSDMEVCADALDPYLGGRPTGSGGTGRLTYAWTGDRAVCLSSTADPNPTLSLACAGPGFHELCVEVTDAINCAHSGCMWVIMTGESVVSTALTCKMHGATEPGILTGEISGGSSPYFCFAGVSPPDSGWTVESCGVRDTNIRVEFSVVLPILHDGQFEITVLGFQGCEETTCKTTLLVPAGCLLTAPKVCEGGTASLCAQVGVGNPPFIVEWEDPTGKPIPGASCTDLDGSEVCCLTICNTQSSDAGIYTAIVMDATGFESTCPAELAVNPCEDCTDDTDCDDANPCTTDVCLPSDVCGHTLIECPGPKTCDPTTGNCVQRGCESHAECDDGVYCNGAETCTNFLCRPGIDSCSDISGSIIQVEDDEACVNVVTPLEGWEVRLLDGSGSLAATDGEGSPLQNPVCTDGNGAYGFTNIPKNPGYLVCEVVPNRLPGEAFRWEPCLPASGVIARDVSESVCAPPNGGTEFCYVPFDLCGGTGGKDFNNFARAIPQADASGLVFCDENGDQVPGSADPGLGGFCIVLTEQDGTQHCDVSNNDLTGAYLFSDIESDQKITVRLDIDGSDCVSLGCVANDNSADWVPTTPTTVSEFLPPGSELVELPAFGNASIPALDCGTGDVTVYASPGECQATFCFAATVENLCGGVMIACEAPGPDGIDLLSPFEDLWCGEFPADLPAATVVTCEATTEANREESCSFEVTVECVGACCADDGNLCDGQEICDSGKCVPTGSPCQPDEVCCQDGTGTSCVVDIQDCVDPPVFQVEWTSPEPGNWSGAENWQPQVIPNVDSGFFAVTIPPKAHVTLDVSATVQDLHIGLGASIEVDPATATTLELRVLGRIENRGEIRVQEGITLRLGQSTIEGGSLTTVGDAAIQLMEGTVLENVTVTSGAVEVGLATGTPGAALGLAGTIDNQGQVAVMGRTILRPDSQETELRLEGGGTVALLAASDAKFEGAGTIACELVNDGTIVANSSGESLTLEPPGDKTNNNLLRAEDGGILRLNADVTGQGKLTAEDGSHVIVKDVTATFDSVTVDEPPGPGATLRLEGSARVPIRRDLRLCKHRPVPGALSLGGCSPPVTLSVTDDSSVEVGGDLVLGKDGSSVAYSSSVAMTLGGDFVNEITEPSHFGWEGGLILDGSAAQTFEVAGEDRGRDPAGFDSNFAMGMVEVAPGAVVTFHDAYPEGQDPCAQALYVQDFVVRSGAAVTVSDCTIYYKSLWLECDASVTPQGCGAIHPVRGDVDGDSDCDLFDYRTFQDCYTGEDGGPTDEGCEQADFDGDHDVDLEDFSGFHLLFGSGPDRCTEPGYGLTTGR